MKNVLVAESYTGVLINNRTQTRCGKAKRVSAGNQVRHEHFYPAIVTREKWQQA